MESKWASAAYPMTAEYLESFGLNPAEISTNLIDVNGYRTFVFDENGKRVAAPTGDLLYEWHAWPSKRVGMTVMYYMSMDENK